MRVKKKTHPVPDMNSEALKKFRQAAYELLVKAKDATSLVDGRSNDNKKCGMFSRIFIKPIIHSSMVEHL